MFNKFSVFSLLNFLKLIYVYIVKIWKVETKIIYPYDSTNESTFRVA